MAIERGVQVDHRRTGLKRNLVDHREDLVADHLRADAEIHIEGRHRLADPHRRRARQRPKRFNHRDVVGDILIRIDPVVRLGVVGAQLDDDDVRIARPRALVGAFADVGLVALAQQGRAADAEILDLPGRVELLQHPLQLGGIAVAQPVRDARSIGDAVADTGDESGVRGRRSGQEDQRDEQGCAFHDSLLSMQGLCPPRELPGGQHPSYLASGPRQSRIPPQPKVDRGRDCR